MSIDVKGTSTGLQGPAPEHIHIKCRRCGEMRAEEIKVDSPEFAGCHVYRCINCGTTRTVNVGGHLNL